MTYLYRLHFAPDNASLIIRLALEELGLAYDVALVNRAYRAQRSPRYLALNPNGLIPVLETPQGPLFETGAILLWLSDRHGGAAPSPDAEERGAYLKWLFFVSNTLHADLRTTFYPALYVGDDPVAIRGLRAPLRGRMARHLGLIEAVAGETPVWLDPTAPTGLLYYLACLLRWMALYPQDDDRDWFRLSDAPGLHTVLTALEDRPAVLTAQAAEGLGPTPFTSPTYADPPQGSAT